MKTINILSYIICPNCKSANFTKKNKSIVCSDCMEKYIYKDDILILVSPKKKESVLKIWNKEEEYNEYEFFTTPAVAREVKRSTTANAVSLDVGCGAGAYQKDFKGAVISFDITPFFVRKAYKNSHKSNRLFLVADANEFPFKDSIFDLVFCSQVIEHFPTRASDKLLKNMTRSSKRRVMVDTPNDGNKFIHSLREILYRGGPSVHADEHLDHHRLVGKKDLEKFGFKVHSCIGYVSLHRFKFGPLWNIYDFIAWRIPDLGGNLVGVLEK